MSNQPKFLTLTEWAEMRFRTSPSAYVLRKLCRDALFDPPAEKIGKTWYIREDAVLVTADGRGHGLELAADAGTPPRRLTLVEQLIAGGL